GVARVASRRGRGVPCRGVSSISGVRRAPRARLCTATRPDAGGGRLLRGGTMKLAHAMVAAAGTATIALAGPAPQAFAAAPSNDTIGGATVIGAVPFSETIDTSQATTDAQDVAINSQCGAPATNGSVWYQLTAAEAGYLVDVSQSTFSAGVIVATGSP